MTIQPIRLKSCPKKYILDLDKAVAPEETIKNTRARLEAANLDVVAATRRIDTGRLGIPVYLAIRGEEAAAIMPTRKQMGKGSSAAQAEASALMELMERFAFFSFWQDVPNAISASWSEAQKLFGDRLLPVAEMLASVRDSLEESEAVKILDTRHWLFYPATRLDNGEIVWLPLDWFRMLGEFNGASAGNTPEESLLQGVCELIERHVCDIVARERPVLPTIDPASLQDGSIAGLVASFRNNGINLILKDFSLGMPVPTIGALAWDPSTFPDKSEIVFTAGTATSPVKAAVRAITEVAQLGGDFCTNSCYEASGLPKFSKTAECAWLLDGPVVKLVDLPDTSDPDICIELKTIVKKLAPIHVYAIDTTHPALGIPAHYCIAPGLGFRERDRNQCLGLFTGRKLAEADEPAVASAGLETLQKICPQAHYLPFFHGLLAMRQNDMAGAAAFFRQGLPMQPDDEAAALTAFYLGYVHTLTNDWESALEPLRMSCRLSPQMKEYANLLGATLFRLGRFAEAEACFERVLKLDKGSAVDLANRGLCRKALGKSDLAAADLAAALELDPSLDFAREHLHKLLKEIKN